MDVYQPWFFLFLNNKLQTEIKQTILNESELSGKVLLFKSSKDNQLI
jgi:hypothetical protein